MLFVSSPDKSGQVYFQEGHYRSAMEDVSLRALLTIARMSTTGFGWEAITCSIFFRPEQSNMSSWYKDSVVSQMNNTVFSHSFDSWPRSFPVCGRRNVADRPVAGECRVALYPFPCTRRDIPVIPAPFFRPLSVRAEPVGKKCPIRR